jgi:hypothetical protein
VDLNFSAGLYVKAVDVWFYQFKLQWKSKNHFIINKKQIGIMDKDKKEKKPKETNEKKPQKKKKTKKLDKELDQTFPASDPPSYSRPGHERTTEDKKKSD